MLVVDIELKDDTIHLCEDCVRFLVEYLDRELLRMGRELGSGI